MFDDDMVRRIGELADEGRPLESAHAGEALSPAERERRRAIKVALEQCWDLLRQRGVRHGAGGDPDETSVRPEGVLEGYRP